jgi:hypothetical protein
MKQPLIVLSILFTLSVYAETNTPPRRGPPTGWSPFFGGGSVYNFETDLDDAGSFSVTRSYMDGGMAYLFRKDRMVSLSVGYGQDDYRFSGTAAEPWNTIETYRASLFTRWGMDNGWTWIATTSLRACGETGADLDDAFTAGGFGGASHTFSDTLSLGPGLGVFGRIEDRPLVIPIIILDWNITEKLSLGTGGGLATTAGPGLTLSYKASKHWNLALSGRYDKKRFRLDNQGLAPNGVGEDRSIPILGSISYVLYPGTHISGLAGYSFNGKFRLEDVYGDHLYDQTYESSFFAGLTIAVRL